MLCHGGPIAEPADAQYILDHTDRHRRLLRASSMERLPSSRPSPIECASSLNSGCKGPDGVGLGASSARARFRGLGRTRASRTFQPSRDPLGRDEAATTANGDFRPPPRALRRRVGRSHGRENRASRVAPARSTSWPRHSCVRQFATPRRRHTDRENPPHAVRGFDAHRAGGSPSMQAPGPRPSPQDPANRRLPQAAGLGPRSGMGRAARVARRRTTGRTASSAS